MMILLHMEGPSKKQAVITIGLFVLADAFVVYMFLMRPFRWHDGSVARFLF